MNQECIVGIGVFFKSPWWYKCSHSGPPKMSPILRKTWSGGSIGGTFSSREKQSHRALILRQCLPRCCGSSQDYGLALEEVVVRRYRDGSSGADIQPKRHAQRRYPWSRALQSLRFAQTRCRRSSKANCWRRCRHDQHS